jgi:hypothetical protein
LLKRAECIYNPPGRDEAIQSGRSRRWRSLGRTDVQDAIVTSVTAGRYVRIVCRGLGGGGTRGGNSFHQLDTVAGKIMQDAETTVTVENAQRYQIPRLDLPQQPQNVVFGVETGTEGTVEPVEKDQGVTGARRIGSGELVRKHVPRKSASFERLAFLHQENGNSLSFSFLE